MGTDHYLLRPDNGTVYELGKSWHFREVFGEAPYTVTPDGIDMLAEELIANALDHEWDETWDEARPGDYLRWVARDIARWSAGKPFVFVNEHADSYERLYERGKSAIRTGSRFIARDEHVALHVERLT